MEWDINFDNVIKLLLETFSIALGCGLDDRGFESWLRLGIFLFTTASRTALGLTQSPIQWLPGFLSLGVKRPKREADLSPFSVGVKECVKIYLHSTNTPSRHGAQLNSTGTTLTLPLSFSIW
jgi:hypothetical protein